MAHNDLWNTSKHVFGRNRESIFLRENLEVAHNGHVSGGYFLCTKRTILPPGMSEPIAWSSRRSSSPNDLDRSDVSFDLLVGSDATLFGGNSGGPDAAGSVEDPCLIVGGEVVAEQRRRGELVGVAPSLR